MPQPTSNNCMLPTLTAPKRCLFVECDSEQPKE